MRVQPTKDQNSSKDVFARRRSPFPTIIIAINALVIGGCLALMVVNWLLKNQLDVYISVQSIAEAGAIIDFMDDMLLLYLVCGSVLLLLALGTFMLFSFKRTKSRFLRFLSVFLIFLAVAAIAAIWFMGASSGPIPAPQLPTAVPSS